VRIVAACRRRRRIGATSEVKAGSSTSELFHISMAPLGKVFFEKAQSDPTIRAPAQSVENYSLSTPDAARTTFPTSPIPPHDSRAPFCGRALYLASMPVWASCSFIRVLREFSLAAA